MNVTPISATAAVAQVVAGLARASRLPLEVTCLGDVEFPGGGFAHGGYAYEQTVMLTRTTCLDVAIAHAENRVEEDALTDVPDGATVEADSDEAAIEKARVAALEAMESRGYAGNT